MPVQSLKNEGSCICVTDINIATFYEFSIEFWNCSDIDNFWFFIYYIEIWLTVDLILLQPWGTQMRTVWFDKQHQGRIQGGGRTRRAPPKIGKNMIFWRKIVIFHTKYPQNFRASLRSAQFF